MASSSFDFIEKNEIQTIVILIGYQYQTEPNLVKKGSQSNFFSSILPNQNINPWSAEATWTQTTRVKLPGILIDLYQAYKFCLPMNPSRLEIITDIEHDPKWRETVGAMGKNLVDSNVLNFINTTRDHCHYNRHRSKQWLISKLTEFSYQADRLFIYYTGHGNDGYLELPAELADEIAVGVESGVSIIEANIGDQSNHSLESTTINRYSLDQVSLIGSNVQYSSTPINNQISAQLTIPKDETEIKDSHLLAMNDLRQICLNQANPRVEALFIFDCCNAIGLDFPFVLRPDGIYRLASKIPRDILSYNKISNLFPVRAFSEPVGVWRNFQRTNQYKFFTAQAICISSTSIQEDSVSTSDGSLFTQHLFTCLIQGLSSVTEIQKYISSKCQAQTCMIHSTYPHLHNLWKWLYGKEKIYRTTVDVNRGLILLKSIRDIY